MNKLHIICQAHLDPVWLWQWRDGFAEVLTTLQSAVDRLREYPDLHYTCSSAAFYRWIQETDPRLFREIRGLIEQGRWEVVGGWVIQADTNLPSELSLHRQGQLGQSWFQEHLGVKATIGYCVDSFGHSAGLPSILKAAGMNYYVFQRPRPEERPDLPNLFWWEAPDGARVLTWRLAPGYGQGPGCSGDEIEKGIRQNWQQGMAPAMSVGTWFVGVGNHGGGPTRMQLDRLYALRKTADPALPELHFSTLAAFFSDIETQPGFNQIPVIHGELLHHARGCYSANTRFKRLHRQAERELGVAEQLINIQAGRPPTVRPTLPPQPPPELHEACWTLAFNQFHDILPGSSVPAAYEQATDELGSVRHTARQITVRTVQTLARQADTRGAPEGTVFLINPLAWSRRAILAVDTFVSPHGDSPITHLASPDGDTVPLQWTAADAGFGPFLKEWKKLVATPVLPAASSKWFHLAHGTPPITTPHPVLPSFIKDTADAAHLVVVDDHGDTWGHQINRWDKVLGVPQVERELLLDDGPVFRRRRQWLSWGRSTVILDRTEWHTLAAAELVLYINWQDRYQTLKLEMPLPVGPVTLRARTPGALVERPLDGDEWFWVEGLTVDTGPNKLAIVSDGVSAYDATPARLRLTLLRCVPHAQDLNVPHPEISPQPFLDEGWQQARFWLAPLTEPHSATALNRLADDLLTPPEHMLDSAHPHGGLA